jgi:hypothetical protein
MTRICHVMLALCWSKPTKNGEKLYRVRFVLQRPKVLRISTKKTWPTHLSEIRKGRCKFEKLQFTVWVYMLSCRTVAYFFFLLTFPPSSPPFPSIVAIFSRRHLMSAAVKVKFSALCCWGGKNWCWEHDHIRVPIRDASASFQANCTVWCVSW